MKTSTKVFIGIILIIGYVVFMISTQSFGVRCKQAGYTGADYEQCVERLADGGGIYLTEGKTID